MTTDRKTDYAVGYGKPPVHTRFKKGNRAYTRGRPRGARNLTTLLLEALDERVDVSQGGRRRKIAKRELGIAQLADKFANGDPYATKLMLGLLLEIERKPPAEPAQRPPLEEADKLVIADLLARLRD
jgi:Family of unknown function (DUF5681)